MNLDLIFIVSMIGLGLSWLAINHIENVIVKFLSTIIIVLSSMGIIYSSIFYFIIQFIKLFVRVLGSEV